MTDKKTEALKLALEALENSRSLEPVDVQWVKGKRHAAITAIREALAEQPAIPQGDIAMPRSIEEAEAMEKLGYAYLQQHAPEMLKEQPAQQEPVAWIDICEKGQMSGLRYWSEPDNRHEVPLYTSPPNVPTALAEQPAPVAKPHEQQYQSTADKCELTPVPAKGGLLPAQQWTDETAKVPDHVWVTPKLRPLAKMAHEQQEPVACKTLCELCVKRGYHFCANAAQTTPIPSPPASKPWVGLTDEERNWMRKRNQKHDDYAKAVEALLKEKNI